MAYDLDQPATLHWMPYDQTPDDMAFRMQARSDGIHFTKMLNAAREAQRSGPEQYRKNKVLPWIEQGENLYSSIEVGMMGRST